PAEGARRHRRRRRRLRVVLLGLAGLVLVVVVGGVLWYRHEADPGPPGRFVVVTIPAGAPVDTIASVLERDQVVGSALALRIYFLVHGAPVVEPGGYYLRRHSSFASVDSGLVGGPTVFPLTIVPGLTVWEVANSVGDLPGHSAGSFLSVATSGAVPSPFAPPGTDNLDGLLGTGTYVVVPGESDRALLTEMVARFDRTAASVGLVSGAAALDMTPYQVVTVASIVQKEGVYPQNVAKVSAVIDNRLAADMPLQMNSTVLYSEHRDGGPVTPADLALDTPYNTYLHKGLPPSPVCFPSEASLEAALHPAAGRWLYFVVVEPDGTEAFADTYAGQLANEQLAQSRGLG
ncbi:MAG TPA: endolytic transglycosylase MltG, partial [Acidimicrobiales bacterium]|nr:endolytic transglycosylase MltG [Acidimicrobiales bacterium]